MTKTHHVPASGKHRVTTNTTPGSQVCLHVREITFQQLWDNYVTGDPYDDPTGAYKNQCAIRMSATLHRVGIDMKSFSQKLIKPAPGKASIGRILLDGKATATRADEPAEWLKLKPFCGLPMRPEIITGADWESKIKGRTGIISFGGYWTRDGESAESASGGHIDLWNGSRLTNNGLLGSVETFARFRLGINRPWLHPYSDLRDSKTILFFEIE
jgi:Type VI secretion system (T6SS), amidase effector protein 4